MTVAPHLPLRAVEAVHPRFRVGKTVKRRRQEKGVAAMKGEKERSAEYSGFLAGFKTRFTNPHASLEENSARGLCLPTDRDLVLRCIRKDQGAWNEFVARYSRVIHQQIRYFLQAGAVSFQREDVEDFSHSVFLAFLQDDSRKLRYFEGKCSLTRWVRIVTTNVVIDQLRKGRPQVSLDAASSQGVCLRDRLPDPRPGAEETLANAQSQSILKQALNKIRPEDRKLALLTYGMEMPVEEIAAVLRISKEAVYTRKHRLQEKLRKALRQATAADC